MKSRIEVLGDVTIRTVEGDDSCRTADPPARSAAPRTEGLPLGHADFGACQPIQNTSRVLAQSSLTSAACRVFDTNADRPARDLGRAADGSRGRQLVATGKRFPDSPALALAPARRLRSVNALPGRMRLRGPQGEGSGSVAPAPTARAPSGPSRLAAAT